MFDSQKSGRRNCSVLSWLPLFVTITLSLMLSTGYQMPERRFNWTGRLHIFNLQVTCRKECHQKISNGSLPVVLSLFTEEWASGHFGMNHVPTLNISALILTVLHFMMIQY